MDSVECAQNIIHEDIEKTTAKLPAISARFLHEKFSECLKYREKLANKGMEIQRSIEIETLNNETNQLAHFEGCNEWLNNLKVLLNNKEELYEGAKNTDNQLMKLQVISLIVNWIISFNKLFT